MSQYRMLRCPVGHVWDPRISGKMCPICGASVNDDDRAKPLPRAVDELESELLYKYIRPVVGWLACIKGARMGQSFTLAEGKNFIGRGDNMDVQILGDAEVSRSNHACIAYDHKNRKFMLVPGDSEGLVYLENKSIFQATELMDLNKIQIGNTTLVFRPLCGEHFSWRDTDEQNNRHEQTPGIET